MYPDVHSRIIVGHSRSASKRKFDEEDINLHKIEKNQVKLQDKRAKGEQVGNSVEACPSAKSHATIPCGDLPTKEESEKGQKLVCRGQALCRISGKS